MKIKLVLDINKNLQAQLNAVVTGRQGDKGTVTVNVFVVDGGVPYNLTGNTIYYEGLKPNNAYVRDTSGVKIINATQGNFEYTFRPETFGVAGIGKRSYFSIEQGGTVRASTQDFGLITLADAMTGNTMSGPYISELEELINLAQWLVDDINSRWTSINTQLTQLQNKLNTMDVVKRSGDTMTGPLSINGAGASTKKLAFQKDGTEVFNLYAFSNTHFGVRDVVGNKNIWEYNTATGEFAVLTNANLVKKTGDTMTGPLILSGVLSRLEIDDKAGSIRINQPSDSTVTARGLQYYEGGTTMGGMGRIRNGAGLDQMYMGWGANPWDANTSLTVSNTAFTYKNKPVAMRDKDGRVNLTLTADGTAFDPSTPSQADRRGNTVTVRLAIRRNNGSSSDIVATLPVDMRPTMLNTLNVPATDGSVVRIMIDALGNVKFNVTNKDVYAMVTYVVD